MKTPQTDRVQGLYGVGDAMVNLCRFFEDENLKLKADNRHLHSIAAKYLERAEKAEARAVNNGIELSDGDYE